MRSSLPRSRPIQVGLALFVLGLGFIAADMIVFFVGGRDTPLWLNLLCITAPLGFLLCIYAALRAGRAEQRAALTAVTAAQRHMAH